MGRILSIECNDKKCLGVHLSLSTDAVKLCDCLKLTPCTEIHVFVNSSKYSEFHTVPTAYSDKRFRIWRRPEHVPFCKWICYIRENFAAIRMENRKSFQILFCFCCEVYEYAINQCNVLYTICLNSESIQNCVRSLCCCKWLFLYFLFIPALDMQSKCEDGIIIVFCCASAWFSR